MLGLHNKPTNEHDLMDNDNFSTNEANLFKWKGKIKHMNALQAINMFKMMNMVINLS